MNHQQKDRIESLSTVLAGKKTITARENRELDSLVHQRSVLDAKIERQKAIIVVAAMEELQACSELTDAVERFSVNEPGIY